MATPYSLIILTLRDLSAHFSEIIPLEIIYYIVNLYRSMPLKSNRILEVAFCSAKSLQTAISILDDTPQYEITFDTKYGVFISEKKSNCKLFHFKDVNTVYCAKPRMTIEIDRNAFSVLLLQLGVSMPVLMYSKHF